MSTNEKFGFESLGYTKAQMEVIENIKASESVQISGTTTTVKRSNTRQLVADLASEAKPLKECGKDD